MKRRHLAFLGLAAVTVAMLVGCSYGSKTAGLRATNAELRLISQSCFQGEIEPCG